MHHQEFAPPEELRDTIKCFWYNNRDFGGQLSSFEVQPDGYAEIIFYFGSGISVSENGVFEPLPSPFMMGLLNQPAVFYTQGRLRILAIRCFPWTVFDLLGLPTSNDGVRVFEHPIAKLQAKLNSLMDVGDINAAIEELKQYFLNARPQDGVDNTLAKAGHAMSGAKGTLPVSQVAEAGHATVRTLERKFKRSSGYTVKDVSALMRFEQVRNYLWTKPDCNLAALAHQMGYTDQSHLSREFKRYSGATPAAFARKAKKGQQMANNNFVAFIQA